MPNPLHQETEYKFLGLGTDTELFLRDKLTKQSIPVNGLLGGTKESPLPVLNISGFSVQEDNVMPEFNIPPARNWEEFSNSITGILMYLQNLFDQKGLELDISPSAIFNYKALNNLQAQTFGCEPDYCVWTLTENDIDTTNPLLRRMRTAGGHIHLSFTKDGHKPELQDTFVVVKALDLFLGVPSILLDNDVRRRQIYGGAGAFRPKNYSQEIGGVEYRTLSNFWIKSPNLTRYIFRQTIKALRFINERPNPEECLDGIKESIIQTINFNNDSMATHLINHYQIGMPFIRLESSREEENKDGDEEEDAHEPEF